MSKHIIEARTICSRVRKIVYAARTRSVTMPSKKTAKNFLIDMGYSTSSTPAISIANVSTAMYPS